MLDSSLTHPDLVLLVPPIIKPCEPSLGACVLARQARAAGLQTLVIDTNIEWFQWVMQPARLRKSFMALESAMDQAQRRRGRQAMDRISRPEPLLRTPNRYANFDRHREDSFTLKEALHIYASCFPAQIPSIADFDFLSRRPTCPDHIREFTALSTSIFDEYINQQLLPQIRRLSPRVIGFSVTFLHQIFPCFRMASLIKQAFPRIRLLLGGALIEAWGNQAARLPLFDLFDATIVRNAQGIRILCKLLQIPGLPETPLVPEAVDWLGSSYFAPRSIIPAAYGHGCYWANCVFCPDHGKSWTQPADGESWLRALAEAAAEHTHVHFHLTDSSLPLPAAQAISQWIRSQRMDITWHGFMRFESILAQGNVIQQLAAGGCKMLEFGLETASSRLLKLLRKGIDLSVVRRTLKLCSDYGIRTYIYLLFGLPSEMLDDRKRTLDFITSNADGITFLNNAVFNLPVESPMAENPLDFGIESVSHREDPLSLYADFQAPPQDPRNEARLFIKQELQRNSDMSRILRRTPAFFKENHAPFIALPEDRV